MKKISRNCLALSSFGLSMAHFCFASFLAASDICFHVAGHTLSGLDVACFLARTMYIRQVAFRSIKWILWCLVHASDISLSPSTFQSSSIIFSNNTSSDVCVVLVTSMYFSGTGNDSSFGMYSLALGSTWWRYMKSPVMVQKSIC